MPQLSESIGVSAPSGVPQSVVDWVASIAELTTPNEIHWCDGSVAERDQLYEEMVDKGTFVRLNQDTRPGSYLARSAPSDVARVE
ncbi:MAG: phosphoenolpyruvate carboxykinase, partial [Propionibacterium sp.]|nr:phosphoenolpyruvate carboxykinase [Propionibacterium sp.]